MTVVLLVRHGRTSANATGVLAGWTPGVVLDENGREGARALGDRLAALSLSAVVTSPLERTVETADLLCAGRAWPISRDERFAEARYGTWTGRSLTELSLEPLWGMVQAHPSSVVFPEGESMAGMAARAVEGVRDWNNRLGPDAVYAVVSHGDVIKAILADALGMHLDAFQRISVDPASVSVVRYTPTRPFVERMNDTGGRFEGLVVANDGDAAVGGGAGRAPAEAKE